MLKSHQQSCQKVQQTFYLCVCVCVRAQMRDYNVNTFTFFKTELGRSISCLGIGKTSNLVLVCNYNCIYGMQKVPLMKIKAGL